MKKLIYLLFFIPSLAIAQSDAALNIQNDTIKNETNPHYNNARRLWRMYHNIIAAKANTASLGSVAFLNVVPDGNIASAATWNAKQPAGNYVTALTGDVTASGPGSVAATLASVNSNVGSFSSANITVDGKGRITAASNGSGGGTITALTGDVTASGSGSVAATLATVNSSVGSFTNASITVDGKGRITAASNGSNISSWTTVSPSNGWGGSIRWRLNADGYYQVVAHLTTGSATNGTWMILTGLNLSGGSQLLIPIVLNQSGDEVQLLNSGSDLLFTTSSFNNGAFPAQNYWVNIFFTLDSGF